MFEAAKSNNRDLALFLLLATTGLRVGGVSNLLAKNICTYVKGEPIISNEGRTIEKGRKWFTFVICERLKEALKKYFLSKQQETNESLINEQKKTIDILKLKCQNYEKELKKVSNFDNDISQVNFNELKDRP